MQDVKVSKAELNHYGNKNDSKNLKKIYLLAAAIYLL